MNKKKIITIETMRKIMKYLFTLNPFLKQKHYYTFMNVGTSTDFYETKEEGLVLYGSNSKTETMASEAAEKHFCNIDPSTTDLEMNCEGSNLLIPIYTDKNVLIAFISVTPNTNVSVREFYINFKPLLLSLKTALRAKRLYCEKQPTEISLKV